MYDNSIKKFSRQYNANIERINNTSTIQFAEQAVNYFAEEL
ncbi:MAG: hypothetical protein ACI93P_001828 [bacterium]|jgi:hypothetical protein